MGGVAIIAGYLILYRKAQHFDGPCCRRGKRLPAPRLFDPAQRPTHRA